MKDKAIEKNEFTEDDIIFECPFCSKSMAIDKRGMGLTINCPECNGMVRVPTVSENSEEGEVRPHSLNMPVEGLADALDESRDEIIALRSKIDELEQLRAKFEEQSSEQEKKLTSLRREFGNIQSALDQVSVLMTDDSANS